MSGNIRTLTSAVVRSTCKEFSCQRDENERSL